MDEEKMAMPGVARVDVVEKSEREPEAIEAIRRAGEIAEGLTKLVANLVNEAEIFRTRLDNAGVLNVERDLPSPTDALRSVPSETAYRTAHAREIEALYIQLQQVGDTLEAVTEYLAVTRSALEV